MLCLKLTYTYQQVPKAFKTYGYCTTCNPPHFEEYHRISVLKTQHEHKKLSLTTKVKIKEYKSVLSVTDFIF